ncbi:WAS/WASL-interacting protein [Amycolatopsis rubida]|uniref:WAS/WASL-interacting protein n=1 Tax=Amycolatopsis rubida TaxID=112413 RepID=A0A1I5DRM8_9PSEU|nr:WAS/WASL-interacting protein [Amycolatopsis rubida]
MAAEAPGIPAGPTSIRGCPGQANESWIGDEFRSTTTKSRIGRQPGSGSDPHRLGQRSARPTINRALPNRLDQHSQPPTGDPDPEPRRPAQHSQPPTGTRTIPNHTGQTRPPNHRPATAPSRTAPTGPAANRRPAISQSRTTPTSPAHPTTARHPRDPEPHRAGPGHPTTDQQLLAASRRIPAADRQPLHPEPHRPGNRPIPKHTGQATAPSRATPARPQPPDSNAPARTAPTGAAQPTTDRRSLTASRRIPAAERPRNPSRPRPRLSRRASPQNSNCATA